MANANVINLESKVKNSIPGAWEMSQGEIKTAHADGDISLNTYIKWAIRFDYGNSFAPGKPDEIDCEKMSNRWSYEIFNSKNKLKNLELYAEDVLRVILILKEKGWFCKVETPNQIQLDLFPVKD
jgi:hypothetical protein